MGMYTGLRFIGTVKSRFRTNFENIAFYGDWENSTDMVLSGFGSESRAHMIPCGALAYMPDEWDTEGKFARYYDPTTGRWAFQCSLKNYSDTIEKFLDIVPYFCESVEHCEYLYEEWKTSRMYSLVGKKMKIIKAEERGY